MTALYTALGVLGTASLLAGLGWRYTRTRRHVYDAMRAGRSDLVARFPVSLNAAQPSVVSPDRFDRERITVIPDAAPFDVLQELAREAAAVRTLQERNYVPGHKQGGTVSYASLHELAPRCVALYHSPALREMLTRMIGTPVWPTADHDQSSCSLLFYSKPGDHIGWHFDHNFYRGRHFTVLLALVNESAEGELSSSRLCYRSPAGESREEPMSPGSLVVFEGARIRHKVTPLGADEFRVVLSMTFGTDPHVAFGREWMRRIKDTAFYGIRALWS